MALALCLGHGIRPSNSGNQRQAHASSRCKATLSRSVLWPSRPTALASYPHLILELPCIHVLRLWDLATGVHLSCCKAIIEVLDISWFREVGVMINNIVCSSHSIFYPLST